MIRRLFFALSLVAPWVPVSVADDSVNSVANRTAAPLKAETERFSIACSELDENSGIAVSQTRPDRLWLHNDSGDKPRLFELNCQGKLLGIRPVLGAEAVDWEDMASCTIDGTPMLIVADTGDNSVSRKTCELYFIPERQDPRSNLRVAKTIHLQFEGGPANCEAIGVDTPARQVLLVAKDVFFLSRVFAINWPEMTESKADVVARQIATVGVTPVTAMDITADGGAMVLLTYADAYQFRRRPGEEWRSALSRPGARIDLPDRRQGEAICYSRSGNALFTTSEKLPTPLFRIQFANGPIRESPLDGVIEEDGRRNRE